MSVRSLILSAFLFSAAGSSSTVGSSLEGSLLDKSGPPTLGSNLNICSNKYVTDAYEISLSTVPLEPYAGEIAPVVLRGGEFMGDIPSQ